ncbi:MAG: hypothetical protein JWO36_6017 [Myxococcales bacterium]|nr:hypothetical protein [Myxococcales bacterium]
MRSERRVRNVTTALGNASRVHAIESIAAGATYEGNAHREDDRGHRAHDSG